jgi:hypothetical protein
MSWFQKAWTLGHLRRAWEQTVPTHAPGIDGLKAPRCRVEDLYQRSLKSYRPLPLLRFTLRSGEKLREIGIPAVEDQILMLAWRQLAEPVLERKLRPHVWGFRAGRDRFGAVDTLCRARLPARFVLVRCDVKSMFESLDHRCLGQAIQWAWPGDLWGLTPEPLLNSLVWGWLKGWQRGIGVPMGASMSPVLSNAYMGYAVDGLLLRLGGVVELVRYADDFAILAEDERVLGELERMLRRARLELNPKKTRIHRGEVRGDWPAWVLGIPLIVERGRLRVLDGEARNGL